MSVPDHQGFALTNAKRVSVFEYSQEESRYITMLCCAVDKYEAAIALYHCICSQNICLCHKGPSKFMSSMSSQALVVGTRVLLLQSFLIYLSSSWSVRLILYKTQKAFFHLKSTFRKPIYHFCTKTPFKNGGASELGMMML